MNLEFYEIIQYVILAKLYESNRIGNEIEMTFYKMYVSVDAHNNIYILQIDYIYELLCKLP